MSHYTVAVFTEPDGLTVEELLAPFDENIEMEDYISATRAEIIKDAKENILRNKKLYEDGEYGNPEYYKTHIAKYVEAALNDDEERLYEYGTRYDSEESLDEDGNRHSTYNPNSKWDWYSIGGRWNGLMKLKNGSRTNEALVKDLDFSPDEEEYAGALRFWDVVVDGQEKKEDEKFFALYRPEYYIKRYGNREGYAKAATSFSTYAVLLPNGEWCEPGQMGWFGLSSASAEEEGNWSRDYQKNFIDSADPNWTITLVDCHI